MKTVTFYSYKGGVGRSLALSNIAIRLSEFNKSVCVLDFDLEAPGLQFKFKNYRKSKDIEKGIVDYIYQYSCEGTIPRSIEDCSIQLMPNNNNYKPIRFIPSGNIDSNDYWQKLSKINWSGMFYDGESKGLKFFLDLKKKIQNEFSPDFLLIDSRTGITDSSAITLRLLADEVVILAANNDENIYGSKKIIKSLLDASNSLFGIIPKINFFLTRLPFTSSAKDKEKEFVILENRKLEFGEYLEMQDFEISVIHSDRRLEEDERPLIGHEIEENGVSISNDYLILFNKLTFGILTPEERKKFKNKKDAEIEFIKSQSEKDTFKRIKHLDRAIELDPNKFEYLFNRAIWFYNSAKYDEAKNDLDKAQNLNPNNWLVYAWLGNLFRKTDMYNEALSYYDKALVINSLSTEVYLNKYYVLKKIRDFEAAEQMLNKLIEIDQYHAPALNSRSDLYRYLGQYEKAYSDIYKAIEIDSSNAIYFGTLAEICASQGKTEEFYLNLTIALSKDIKEESLNSAKDVYEKFKHEERFLNLLAKYNLDIDEVLRAE